MARGRGYGRLAPPLEQDKRGVPGWAGLTAMGVLSALFAIAAAAIVAVWGWLGSTGQMPPSPLASGGKLYCISYTPFPGGQKPFGPGVSIHPPQIDQDLAQLKHVTHFVRTDPIHHRPHPI